MMLIQWIKYEQTKMRKKTYKMVEWALKSCTKSSEKSK